MKTKNTKQMEDFIMENTKNYVIAEVGFEALFEAMVAQAEADIETGKKKIETAKRIEASGHNLNHVEPLRKAGDALIEDAMRGLADWVKVLRILDIADAVIK